ncbi:MAG: hypothetical protein EBE86_021935 [Hormoscilla sp. GUM202]|nr:hypothetical protein [Hormoscilla sp. GUM202]
MTVKMIVLSMALAGDNNVFTSIGRKLAKTKRGMNRARYDYNMEWKD